MNMRFRTSIFSTIMSLMVLFLAGTPVFANHNRAASPKKVNLFLSLQLTLQDVEELSRWDMVVLDMEHGVRHPDLIRRLRAMNPKITILAYISPQEILNDVASVRSLAPLRVELAERIPESWYIHNSVGGRLSFWPGTSVLNVTTHCPVVAGDTWQTYLARFIATRVLSTSLWDGIFYDNAWDNITYFVGQDVDITGDYRTDPSANDAWRAGMRLLYSETRRQAGRPIILVGNNDTLEYKAELDGMLLENLNTTNWTALMQKYEKHRRESGEHPVNMINANTNNQGAVTDYKMMRFGLTSALLEDGYYSFDFGDQNHGQLWWYDEYGIDLGRPVNVAVSRSQQSTYAPDVWQREFEFGLSVVNSTSDRQRVVFDRDYEKIIGKQDATVNDGAIVSELVLQPYDGQLLLKTFSVVNDMLFDNGSFVRFFGPTGARIRNGFFTFEEQYAGGMQIAHVDLNGNGLRETIVIGKNKISAWRDDGQILLDLFPYPTTAKDDGLEIAVGNFNDDSAFEIVVAPRVGHVGPVRVYSKDGNQIGLDWYPFGKNYAGGMSLAVGNVDGDGANELIIGSGKGVTATVSVYSRSLQLIRRFAVFEKTFRGGVSIATGNVDGKGYHEIIVGPRTGKKPVIQIFDVKGKKLYPDFVAYATRGLPGIDVRSVDVNFDGVDDVVAMSKGVQ